MRVCLHGCPCTAYTQCRRRPEEGFRSGTTGTGVQRVVSRHAVLGTELQASERAVGALTWWAVSPLPQHIFKFISTARCPSWGREGVIRLQQNCPREVQERGWQEGRGKRWNYIIVSTNKQLLKNNSTHAHQAWWLMPAFTRQTEVDLCKPELSLVCKGVPG